MLAGSSEISINVIAKHVCYVGTTWACGLPGADLLGFSVPGGREKIAGLWFALGNQYSGWQCAKCDHLISLKLQNVLCQPW